MINSDREVFEHIGQNPETGLEIDFLTYAIYAYEKYQWMELFKQQTGDYPTEEEAVRWISQITNFRFAGYREDAARLFDSAARSYMAEEIEREKQRAVRESILNEVRAAASWWRQTGIALITAILAPLIIGSLIVGALWYDQLMFTATDVVHRLEPPSITKTP